MEAMKAELERKRRVLREVIGTERRRGAERNELTKEMSKDPYGSASLIHDDEVIWDMTDRRIRELQQIDRALDDIEAGRYGICQDCGEAIAKARLKAMPFALRCVACQAEREQLERAA